ncbi:hypothetical protein D3C73_619940 [compost metagenome]
MDMLKGHSLQLFKPGIGETIGGAGVLRRCVIIGNSPQLAQNIARPVMLRFQRTQKSTQLSQAVLCRILLISQHFGKLAFFFLGRMLQQFLPQCMEQPVHFRQVRRVLTMYTEDLRHILGNQRQLLAQISVMLIDNVFDQFF